MPVPERQSRYEAEPMSNEEYRDFEHVAIVRVLTDSLEARAARVRRTGQQNSAFVFDLCRKGMSEDLTTDLDSNPHPIFLPEDQK